MYPVLILFLRQFSDINIEYSIADLKYTLTKELDAIKLH